MTQPEIKILGTAIGKAVDEVLAEFIADEIMRGMMRGAIIQKLNENLIMLLNPKTND